MVISIDVVSFSNVYFSRLKNEITMGPAHNEFGYNQ